MQLQCDACKFTTTYSHTLSTGSLTCPLAGSVKDTAAGPTLAPLGSQKCNLDVKKKKNTWILEMEEVSGSIIYLPGISKQICLSSPPLYSWQFHGLSYTCLGSFHSHRPEEQSSPNPQFSFFNSIFLRLLQNSPFITPLPLAQPPFCIPNIFLLTDYHQYEWLPGHVLQLQNFQKY